MKPWEIIREKNKPKSKEWQDFFVNKLRIRGDDGEEVEFIQSIQKIMVGLLIKMFVKRGVEVDINDMCKHEVKTANGGLTGNKGSVALRFDLKDTSFMFMNCHLAPHDNSHMERMENLRKNISENFNEFFKNIDCHTLGHNYKCIFGDFNSRMDQPITREEIIEKVSQENW